MATIAEIQAKLEEQRKLLSQFEMWRQVQEQGIIAEDIACFGFDPELMSAEQKREARKKAWPAMQSANNPDNWSRHRDEEGREFIRAELYNYVKLHNGEKVKLDPVIKRPD